jgi:hypothetical protein
VLGAGGRTAKPGTTQGRPMAKTTRTATRAMHGSVRAHCARQCPAVHGKDRPHGSARGARQRTKRTSKPLSCIVGETHGKDSVTVEGTAVNFVVWRHTAKPLPCIHVVSSCFPVVNYLCTCEVAASRFFLQLEGRPQGKLMHIYCIHVMIWLARLGYKSELVWSLCRHAFHVDRTTKSSCKQAKGSLNLPRCHHLCLQQMAMQLS